MARLKSLRKNARCEGGLCFNSDKSRRKSAVDNPCALRFLRLSGTGKVKQSDPQNVITFDIAPPKNRNGWAVLRLPSQ